MKQNTTISITVEEKPETALSAERDLLERFKLDVERQGLVGEKNNACVAFLAAVSAKLTTPLSVTVQGSSSSGKNHLLNCVCEFIPERDKKIISGMTSKVLMHAGETEYEHKVVVIAEYEGAKKADYAIRTFQSERRIQWEFVDTKGSRGIQKKTNTVNGPAAFLQATTESVLHPENETRLLFVEIDESKEQTAKINLQQALFAAGQALDRCNAVQEWRTLLGSLKTDMKITIPFATQIVPFFPAERVRSRRDFPKLLGLIEATAYLHQHQRDRGDDGAIIASPADYITAKKLFEHCYEFGPDRRLEELLRQAQKLGTFRVADIIQQTLGP
jgi:DNA primase